MERMLIPVTAKEAQAGLDFGPVELWSMSRPHSC